MTSTPRWRSYNHDYEGVDLALGPLEITGHVADGLGYLTVFSNNEGDHLVTLVLCVSHDGDEQAVIDELLSGVAEMRPADQDAWFNGLVDGGTRQAGDQLWVHVRDVYRGPDSSTS